MKEVEATEIQAYYHPTRGLGIKVLLSDGYGDTMWTFIHKEWIDFTMKHLLEKSATKLNKIIENDNSDRR